VATRAGLGEVSPVKLVGTELMTHCIEKELELLKSLVAGEETSDQATLVSAISEEQEEIVSASRLGYWMLAMILEGPRWKALRTFLLRRAVVGVHFACQMPAESQSDAFHGFENYGRFLDETIR
jgi:hypothetical protein